MRLTFLTDYGLRMLADRLAPPAPAPAAPHEETAADAFGDDGQEPAAAEPGTVHDRAPPGGAARPPWTAACAASPTLVPPVGPRGHPAAYGDAPGPDTPSRQRSPRASATPSS